MIIHFFLSVTLYTFSLSACEFKWYSDHTSNTVTFGYTPLFSVQYINTCENTLIYIPYDDYRRLYDNSNTCIEGRRQELKALYSLDSKFYTENNERCVALKLAQKALDIHREFCKKYTRLRTDDVEITEQDILWHMQWVSCIYIAYLNNKPQASIQLADKNYVTCTITLTSLLEKHLDAQMKLRKEASVTDAQKGDAITYLRTATTVAYHAHRV